MTGINAVGVVVGQIDSIILNHFWGPAQLATYSIALAIPNRAIPFFKSWVDTGFPKIAAKSVWELNATLYRRVWQGLAAGVAVAAVYVFAAPYLFTYLMPQYVDATFYTQLLAAGFVFALPNRYMTMLFTSQKMSQVIFFNNLAQGLLRIAFYAILGIWLGVLGLVIVQAVFPSLSLLINIAVWLYSATDRTEVAA